ncbi:hypothetical protein HYC85_022296 [Camellia sinensis]|uniref:NB-ARC domain-containing protein n=1 Tax=Camellia sinensis TaxID=4442 RepID=A0A7J7GK02_CAMSI|nr:hypothetical protein HYC85_022296 [Camellia sinensis]
MRGIGKTTMVKEVAKKAEEKKMFDIMMMVVVSQNPNLINIQSEIAKILCLKNFEGNNLPTGAGEIRSKILKSGRVLVILDDVWKRLELNDIGIPCGDHYKGCKIVMTSRSEDVCIGMDADKNFKVGVLREKEAWNLFKEMATLSNDGTSHPTDLQLTQMAVAKECGGLSIAIVTVGKALRCKNNYSWDSALEQLRKSMVKNISGMDEKVFKSLKLSYDSLESDEAKKCFLLCSLYPEDFDIPIEDLVRFAIGIELFERIDSVHQARNRVYSLVDNLKKCYLLVESDKVERIKMHDVVRDVAISIASREEHSFLVRCDEALKEWLEKNQLQKNTVISLKVNGMHWLPGNLEFPYLQLLQLDCNAGLPPISSYDLNKRMEKVKVQETPDSLYQGMRELKVLALSNMYSSLPTSFPCLTNLRTLSLFCCRLIDDDISIIGALENLEILRFGGSYIKELPKEIIGHLAHLKVLDLFGCEVERIYPGVLSSLSKLEELYVGSSFDSFCKQSKEGAKAVIDELASLSNLMALHINPIDISFWPRGLVVEKFTITVHTSSSHHPCYRFSNQLDVRRGIVSDYITESRLYLLLKRTEILTLYGCVIRGFESLCDLVDGDGFECLTKLSPDDLYNLEYLINTADGVPQSAFPVLEDLCLCCLGNFKGITSHECRLPNKAFSALKVLSLYSLRKLTNLWKGPTQLVWLGNLTTVDVMSCDKLESMFSLSIARGLVQLQVLQIWNCHVMEEIVSSEGGEHEIAAIATDKIEFPKLKKLCLGTLPNFTAICKAMNAIELPQLSSLTLSNVPKLKRLWAASDSESNCDPIIQPLFNDKSFRADFTGETIRSVELDQWIGNGRMEIGVVECKLAMVKYKSVMVEVRWVDGDCDRWTAMVAMVGDGSNGLRSSVKHPARASTHRLPLERTNPRSSSECTLPAFLRNQASARAPNSTLERTTLHKNYWMDEFPARAPIPPLERTGQKSGQLVLDSKLNQPLIFRVGHIFRNLRKLTITDINGSIEMWQNQLDVGRIDKVTFMLVQFCGKLSSVISLNFVRRLQHLQLLKVWWCDSLETIFDLQGSVCASTTGAEGSLMTLLKDMKLMYLPKLTHIWMNVSQHTWGFINLISLEVEKCDNLRYIFPISMVKGLVSLKYLRIENCEKVEKIVTGEAEEERGKINILSVELQNLPSLVCFGIPESQIHISKLCVDFCPKYRGNQLYFYANMFLSF